MAKFILTLCFLFCSSGWSLESIKLAPGRYITVENNILNPREKVLVMLPGVYRGFDSRDEVIKMAKKQKLNFISLNYSLQPESLLLISPNERPYFETHSYQRSDLANEVLAVIQEYKIERPILVSLSYSASITSELLKNNNFELVIETSPMMRFDESDPQSVAILTFWKNWLSFNPYIGKELARSYLLNSFRTYWAPRVDDLLKKYPQYHKTGFREVMISGYANMSIVAEGFDFTNQDLTKSRRYFILGEAEEKERFELQLKAVKAYENITGQKNASIIVKGSGHVIPKDAPQVYLDLLRKLVF
jgi:hypothetical protein